MSATNVSIHRMTDYASRYPKQLFIGAILVVALFAFEIFNFDTTEFALSNILGNTAFAGIAWATILAIAFCGIDLAGLVRLFTPQSGADEPKEVWYLMGAWLLGATMNAVMTWWAVSLTLLNNDFGNEVLSRQQLLRYVPIFVAILVWLTRILFIGSISVAGEHLLGQRGPGKVKAPRRKAPIRSRLRSRHGGSGKKSAAKQAAPPPQTAGGRTNSRPKQATPARKPPVKKPPVRKSSKKPVAVQQPPLPAMEPPPPPPTPYQPPAPKRKPLNGRPKANGRVRRQPPRPGMRPPSINAGPQING